MPRRSSERAGRLVSLCEQRRMDGLKTAPQAAWAARIRDREGPRRPGACGTRRTLITSVLAMVSHMVSGWVSAPAGRRRPLERRDRALRPARRLPGRAALAHRTHPRLALGPQPGSGSRSGSHGPGTSHASAPAALRSTRVSHRFFGQGKVRAARPEPAWWRSGCRGRCLDTCPRRSGLRGVVTPGGDGQVIRDPTSACRGRALRRARRRRRRRRR